MCLGNFSCILVATTTFCIGEEIMRILIADQEVNVRFALHTLLRRQAGLEIAGEAATAEELLVQAETTQPDLVLLHWRLAESAPGLIASLRKLCPGLHIIVLSVRSEIRHDALAAGADAFVSKTYPPEKLLAAIAAVGPAHDPGAGDRHGTIEQERASEPEGSLELQTSRQLSSNGSENVGSRMQAFRPW
jgi:DNA-binding NarL/FixJ family response regulator